VVTTLRDYLVTSGSFLLGGRLKHRRTFGICTHRSTITTITAGLAREVCETCAHVSVRYIEPAVQIFPESEVSPAGPSLPTGPSVDGMDEAQVFEAMVSFEASTRRLVCSLCSQPARFLIPEGLTCEEHAWQAAAGLDWEDSDPWVPIRIGIAGT
jgi:hypothetical protein